MDWVTKIFSATVNGKRRQVMISVPELLTLTRHAHQWLADAADYRRWELLNMTADEKLAEVDHLYDGGLKQFYINEGVGK